jgi:hypothetical protein
MMALLQARHDPERWAYFFGKRAGGYSDKEALR